MPSFFEISTIGFIFEAWAISISLGTAFFFASGAMVAMGEISGKRVERGNTQYRNRQNEGALTLIKAPPRGAGLPPRQARMHPSEKLLREFYAAFARRDAEGMAHCYHPEVFFSDPVFPRLHGAEAADMWRMLLARSADLEVSLEEARADDEGGHARW